MGWGDVYHSLEVEVHVAGLQVGCQGILRLLSALFGERFMCTVCTGDGIRLSVHYYKKWCA